MNILYLSGSHNWHVDLWTRFFVEKHNVFLFSDKVGYLKDQPYEQVRVFTCEGYLGGLLNTFGFQNHSFYQLNKLISKNYFAKKINEILINEKIDIIHAHSLYFGYLASYIQASVPVIFTPMGSDVILHAQERGIYNRMAHRAFLYADVVTGDSELLQKKGFELGAKKENNYIVQNGVDASVFYPKSNDLKNKYQVEENEILIFSPRAIDPIYNIDVIINSIAQLVRLGYKIKCMFSFAFGDQYSEKLKSLVQQLDIEPNIIWLGYLTYESMADHYNAADIIISVPRSDSSPKSVYEAMFCSKPVIVSDLDWTYERASEVECFLRVEVGDKDQLSDAIKRLIENEYFSKELSLNGLAHARKFFDYEQNMREMEKIMLDAVRRK